MLRIIKRDGRIVPFDKKKIVNAINNALIDVDGILYEEDTANDIADEIEEKVAKSSRPVSVEAIQNCVEEELMESERKDVARAYIRYRYKREAARDQQNIFFSAIGDKLRGVGIENANANMDENSFSGRIGTASNLMLKQYALEYCMSKKSKENHLNNRIYIHDLDHYAVGTHNCLSVPFDDLLANGFTVRQTDVRPANSVNTAFQLVAVIFQLQSLQQFGGVSATHLDWTMVPYVRKSFYKYWKIGKEYVDDPLLDFYPNDNTPIDDYPVCPAKRYAYDMTVKEIYQAVEGMFHNLNTLQSRSGGQLPFTSINFGTCTLPEGRLIIKAILETGIKGLGKFYKTSIFPCTIFQCMKGVNRKPGEPNYDLYQLALESTSKRLYPNYANVDWSGNAGYDPDDPKTYFSTMGLVA